MARSDSDPSKAAPAAAPPAAPAMSPLLEALFDERPPTDARFRREVLGLDDAELAALAGTGNGISRAEARLLMETVDELDARRTLEVGLANGVSAVAICEALDGREGARHVAIDPYQTEGFEGLGMRNLERAGHGALVELYEEPSYRALPRLEAAGTRLDLAFIDGWHTFDFALVDFFYIDRMLRVGGVVAFDDADWPSVRRVLRFVVANLPYEVHRTLPPEEIHKSRERRAYEAALGLSSRLVGAAGRLPRLRKPLTRALGAEMQGIDRRHGLDGSCILLRKTGEDERRPWHFEVF